MLSSADSGSPRKTQEVLVLRRAEQIRVHPLLARFHEEWQRLCQLTNVGQVSGRSEARIRAYR